jgi:7,8-dihydroneopterin aldolase/epimerase/oxygenase
MGTISLEGIEFYSFHGCYKEEQIIGSKFIVDLSIETDCGKPSETDNINDALNYQEVFEIIKNEMSVKSHLLENIAKRIIDSICNNFSQIDKITVKISKINPPITGKMDRVSVILTYCSDA